MTNEEAIKWLDEHTLGRLGKGGFEAKIKIVKALNRQIPMKPIENSIRFVCPTCNQPLPNVAHNNCMYCGQRIDWSEE